ncbi:nuclear transport factor 2 family protein [Sphingomonas sp. GV3]|uniref:nuclear transport factor 2 family protein n=1 Tax=Sphingomonas sp. GV3 TaxID=3040671 RepID=UPI00280C3E5D|nr:nuclear transport factor 2 family protein [Sphingomonas sp. GV3]
MSDSVQDFPKMLREALGNRVVADAVSFTDMLADDAVMEFPFTPPGMPERLEGRDAVAEHLVKLARLISFDRIGPATVIASDARTSVLAFEGIGRGIHTGVPYEQRYLSVITTCGGRIVRYVDYWNPLAVVRAVL